MLTPPEPLGQCDSDFIGMFLTVRFIQMMSLTFGLFTKVSGSGPLGPLVYMMGKVFSCLISCRQPGLVLIDHQKMKATKDQLSFHSFLLEKKQFWTGSFPEKQRGCLEDAN